MLTYHKRNGAFIYNHGQADILVRILEVVFKKETAFWLYSILIESILPLDYFTNLLYPQALLEYMMQLMEKKDLSCFIRWGEDAKMFGMKSFFSLFANLTITPTFSNKCQKFEMAYSMLDILLLLGDPKESITLSDNPNINGTFMVGEYMPVHFAQCNEKPDYEKEHKVRIDRTSQLLISMNLAIAE